MRTSARIHPRRILPLILVVVAASLFSGCGAARYSGPPLKMRLGIQPGPQSALIWVAEEEGLFTRNGLTVTLCKYDAGFNAVKGLGANESDVATCSEFAFVANAYSNPDLRILASIATGDTTSLVARRDRGISSPASLAGKRVAVTPGVANQFFVGRFLTLHGMGLNDVTLVSADEQSAKKAVVEGAVDAAVLFEPDVKEAADELGPDCYIIDVQSGQDYFWLLSSTGSYVKANKEAVRRLLATMVEAERFTDAHPAAAQQDLRRGSRLSLSYVRYVWPKFTFAVRLGQPLVLAMEDEARWTVDNGLFGAKTVPDYLDYVYLEGLQQVAPEVVTIY